MNSLILGKVIFRKISCFLEISKNWYVSFKYENFTIDFFTEECSFRGEIELIDKDGDENLSFCRYFSYEEINHYLRKILFHE